ncbi:hypothetical protein P7K49_034335 [Saguinus oedipus]|uniref:Uncharacterized protein n=1 Tax=Saguinus oedipus TaxID=9490 RepID=A0ABQ9TUF9_SAGOE|nr:hypothetical protein P7K49_034335 [Saguinus oedipus]
MLQAGPAGTGKGGALRWARPDAGAHRTSRPHSPYPSQRSQNTPMDSKSVSPTSSGTRTTDCYIQYQDMSVPEMARALEQPTPGTTSQEL